jgi:ABC-type cobalamin/Fe3+-siderophores transport system ATPase subunit
MLSSFSRRNKEMRILELEVENIRGIRKKIHLSPNDSNTVICGPNGSGKSAVVDAMDFLFTGDMSRLAGRGISLKEHGPHIDAPAKDAVVSARIQIDGIDDALTIRREMSKPKELICPEIESELVAETLEIARRGQHVLSRSEILKYIAAEASKRAEEIQAVLNLEKVESIRKLLVTIKRDGDKTLQTEKTNYETSKTSIVNAIGVETFSEKEVLKKVNECRETLNGNPLEDGRGQETPGEGSLERSRKGQYAGPLRRYAGRCNTGDDRDGEVRGKRIDGGSEDRAGGKDKGRDPLDKYDRIYGQRRRAVECRKAGGRQVARIVTRKMRQGTLYGSLRRS